MKPLDVAKDEIDWQPCGQGRAQPVACRTQAKHQTLKAQTMFTNDSYISPRCSSPLFGRARRPNLQSLLASLPAHAGAPVLRGAPTHASTGTSRPQVIGFTLLVERNALNANPRIEGQVGRPLHELQPACGEALLSERPKKTPGLHSPYKCLPPLFARIPYHPEGGSGYPLRLVYIGKTAR